MSGKHKKNTLSFKAPPGYDDEDKVAAFKSSSDASRPYFSFRYICDADFSMKKCSIEQFRSLSDKLRILSDLEWSKIRSSPRETNGFENIPAGDLYASLPSAFSKEKVVNVFRIANKKGRIVGIIKEPYFYVLFIDSNFTLYKHN